MPHFFVLIDRLLIVLLLALAVPILLQLVPELWAWRLGLIWVTLVLLRVTARLLLSRRTGPDGGKDPPAARGSTSHGR